MTGTFRLVRCELGFIVVLFLSLWFGVAWLQRFSPDNVGLSFQVGWAAVSALVCFLELEAIQYFDSFLPLPSKTSLVVLCIALLGPLIVLKQVFVIFSGLELLRVREVFLIAPPIALLCWAYQWLAGLWFRHSGVKRRLWLFLNEEEKQALTEEIRQSGLEPYYSFDATPNDAELLVISKSSSRRFSGSSELLLAHLRGVPVCDVHYLLSEMRKRIAVDKLDLWFFLLTATPQGRTFRIFFTIKSFTEPLLAAILLVLSVPACALIALAIKLSDGGPVLYLQRRTGYRGRIFDVIKFRTMIVEAETAGPAWAGQQQGKVTRLGLFLRRSHLDEIPQLWNVLRSEMSFVGPRPERPEYYEILQKDIPLFWVRTLVRPGITGWAQVRAGYASSVDESREKLEYDLYYMKRMSPVIDILIFAKTLLILLNARDELAK